MDPDPDNITKIQVFKPTWEEFKDFNKYIIEIEKKGAHKAGLAKIIPPPEWKPRADNYNMDIIGEIEIPAPISQVVQGKQGVYQVFNIQKNAMKVKDFKRMANSAKYATPPHTNYDDLDRKYWRNIAYCPPIYGADVSGSLTDVDVKEWNINKLGSILDFVNEDYGISIDGVNTAYLYFGMWKSCFAWHTEDMDLYSINYLHFGEPKSWYSVPPEHGARLERLANNFFTANYKECPAYLRHKMSVISPTVLKNHSIPYNKIVQEAGEFMITFPYGYHAGFNHGFNCAESTNFASPRWVEYGKRATQCACRPDMVKISMETFVKRFQPERYDLWLQGKDIGPHPANPGRNSAAPHPSKDDILWNKNYTDLPEQFVEPTNKKAKRHLIHQQLEEEQSAEPKTQLDQEMAMKPVDVLEKSDSSEEKMDADEDLNDFEHFEVMKEIYYKAGEMESDGLEDLKSEEEEVEEEWEPENVGLDVKPKTVTKKTVKRSKSKTNVDSNATNIKHRRTKSESVPVRPVSPRSQVVRVAEASTTVVKCSPLKSKALFHGFRIPKKTQSLDSRGTPMSVDCSNWGDNDCQESPSFNSYSSTSSSKMDEDAFSKTRIQKPSPNSHIKSCPVTAATPICVSSSSSASYPSTLNTAHPASTTDLHRQQFTCITSTNKSPCSPVDERRSRKQKSPRKGLDSREVSANMTLMWEKQKEWTWANECEFNMLNSHQEPFCCVCSVLRPSAPQKPQPSIEQQPKSSSVLLPETLFGSDRHTITISILLRCSSCCVCVHAKCCGLAESTVTDNWMCRRCERNVTDRQKIRCCLCQKRGGILKATTDNRWIHIVCTICFPGVSFVEPVLREPIVFSSKGWNDYVRLNCFYCTNSRSDFGPNSVAWHRGICLPCVNKKICGRAFHPLCGLVNGVRFTLSQDGHQFIANCCSTTPRSTINSSTSVLKKKPTVHISIGQQVYAKHPATNEYHLADVTDNTQTITYYSVDFHDGSRSDDTYPEDIRNYNCKMDGPPPMGAAVDVLWTDGKSYDGHYRGVTYRKLYNLSFRDGTNTVITAERPDFYHPDEDLPKDLRIQLDKQRAAAAQMRRLQYACPGIQP